MKSIINGVTYNTETSTRVGLTRYEGEDDKDGDTVTTLYQNRGGAFFLHHETTKSVWNQKRQQQEEKVINNLEPMSPDAAQAWLLEGNPEEVFNNPFGDPAEARSEEEPSATLYIRVPLALKKQVEEAAEKANQSSNGWVMRCVEACLQRSSVTPI